MVTGVRSQGEDWSTFTEQQCTFLTCRGDRRERGERREEEERNEEGGGRREEEVSRQEGGRDIRMYMVR